MDYKFQKYLHKNFTKLVEKYGFYKLEEQNDELLYLVKYGSATFVITLEKYRQEFYVTLYKTGYPDSGIELFNLLSYLNQRSANAPEFKPFEEENDLDERYKKQISYISDTIDNNFPAINDFFESGSYELKVANIREFMLNKYPDLFKRI